MFAVNGSCFSSIRLCLLVCFACYISLHFSLQLYASTLSFPVFVCTWSVLKWCLRWHFTFVITALVYITKYCFQIYLSILDLLKNLSLLQNIIIVPVAWKFIIIEPVALFYVWGLKHLKMPLKFTIVMGILHHCRTD